MYYIMIYDICHLIVVIVSVLLDASKLYALLLYNEAILLSSLFTHRRWG